MENELKTPNRNFRSEKFVSSESLAEWKTALMINFFNNGLMSLMRGNLFF